MSDVALVLGVIGSLFTIVGVVLQFAQAASAFHGYERWTKIRDDAAEGRLRDTAEQWRRYFLARFVAAEYSRTDRRKSASLLVSFSLGSALLIWLSLAIFPDPLEAPPWVPWARGILILITFFAGGLVFRADRELKKSADARVGRMFEWDRPVNPADSADLP